jgi:very-short-patch-repair endonuclease
VARAPADRRGRRLGRPGHRLAFERDRARDLAHTLAGWTVVRFTHRQVTPRPLEVASKLAVLLTRG